MEQPIPLNQIPIQLGLLFFAASLVWSIGVQIYYYPRIGRFDEIYARDKSSKKFLNLRIVIFCWGSLILLTGFAVWSLFRFAQLINFSFADGLSFVEKLVSVALPFVYLIIPQYIARFSTSIALLAAPEDYGLKRRQEPESFSLGFNKELLSIFDKDPRFAGQFRTIDTAISLLILLFTPSVIKKTYEFQAMPLMLFIVALLVLLGGFTLIIRADRDQWAAGRLRDVFFVLGKLIILLFLLTFVATLREIDLVEIGFFGLLGGWILLAALAGATIKHS